MANTPPIAKLLSCIYVINSTSCPMFREEYTNQFQHMLLNFDPQVLYQHELVTILLTTP